MYLSCGIATNIVIKKGKYSTGEILEDLKLKMNLDIFDITDKEDYILLQIKKDIFENNIIDFIKSQISTLSIRNIEKDFELLDSMKGKKFDEMIEYADTHKRIPFAYSEGYFNISNDISYIFTNISCDIAIDMITFLSEGKIIMEEYFYTFKYLREKMVNATDNVLKDALFLVMT